MVEQAKAAVQALGGALKAELEAAMKTGGPEAALSVCQIKAPELAKAISDSQGMAVKRVSLKNRNPVMGAANEWQTKVLNDFETRKAAGEDPATLAYAEVVDHEFRFMKAIPTAAVCLGCHGTNLSPAVTAKLTELYPQDQAVGYKEGDLRGAFVVVKNLAQ
ncbi:MAG: Tll0287-like domain-containing protein [Methylobacter sp.]